MVEEVARKHYFDDSIRSFIQVDRPLNIVYVETWGCDISWLDVFLFINFERIDLFIFIFIPLKKIILRD